MSMTNNLRHWEVLGKTDPKQTKPFQRAGGFKGTATKPIWLTMRLTEHFGPCGVGWGMEKPEFETVAAGDEILVFCTVGLWYVDGGARALVYGVGGDKVMGKNKYGPFTNDEAFKASYTDALSNAMKQIGVAADIHMGMFDDNKYVRAMEREFAGEPAADPLKAPDDARALADAIKNEIDHEADVPGVNAVMVRRGFIPSTGQVTENSDLAKVRAAGEAAFKFLLDRANNRRGLLMQSPTGKIAS